MKHEIKSKKFCCPVCGSDRWLMLVACFDGKIHLLKGEEDDEELLLMNAKWADIDETSMDMCLGCETLFTTVDRKILFKWKKDESGNNILYSLFPSNFHNKDER